MSVKIKEENETFQVCCKINQSQSESVINRQLKKKLEMQKVKNEF